MTLHVTVRDDEDGTEETTEVADDDYFLVCSGKCKVAWGGVIPWELLLPEASPLPLPLVPDLHFLIISGRHPS